ncbi:MAG: hypothetical protein KKI04_04460 [Proteobacteria bacterium]|nr:hypothetical protein [Pseudomonadota bacterium]
MFSVGHEYLIVYAKSLDHLKEIKTIWREQKPGAREIIEYWQNLREQPEVRHFSSAYKFRERRVGIDIWRPHTADGGQSPQPQYPQPLKRQEKKRARNP